MLKPFSHIMQHALPHLSTVKKHCRKDLIAVPTVHAQRGRKRYSATLVWPIVTPLSWSSDALAVIRLVWGSPILHLKNNINRPLPSITRLSDTLGLLNNSFIRPISCRLQLPSDTRVGGQLDASH
jgi:hypothetical protein